MRKGMVAVELLALVAIFIPPAMAGEYLHLNLPGEDTAGYGGIPSPVDRPPAGTAINEELSKYYGVPVATRDMEIRWVKVEEYLYGDFDNVVTTMKPVIVKSESPTRYFYISGWWFAQNEMMNLPAESLMYGQSPYAIIDDER